MLHHPSPAGRRAAESADLHRLLLAVSHRFFFERSRRSTSWNFWVRGHLYVTAQVLANQRRPLFIWESLLSIALTLSLVPHLVRRFHIVFIPQRRIPKRWKGSLAPTFGVRLAGRFQWVAALRTFRSQSKNQESL